MSTLSYKTSTIQEKPEINKLEEKILEKSGLKLNEELFVYDVQIEMKGKSFQIHTYRCGDENKEDLVLLHGYGGSSLLYYPMLKDLATKFRVFCLDFAGMGLSTKEHFDCKSTEETIDYFVETIEKWRVAVGLDSFYLAGHSFGGYISGHYCLRYQSQVKKLFLLSPIGITNHKQEKTTEEVKKEMGFFKGMAFGVLMQFYEKRMTPNGFITDHPWIGKFVIKSYVTGRFNLKGADADIMLEFMMKMLSMPPGSQEAIHYLMKPPRASAYIPLEESIINQLKMPIVCLFGQEDYMDMAGANRIQSTKSKMDFSLKIVPKAAHQLTMQNPKFVTEEILLEVDA